MIDELDGGENGERAGGSGTDQSSSRVHGVVVTPGDLVISALYLGLRIEFLAPHLIRAKVREVHKGFGELEEHQSSVNKGVWPSEPMGRSCCSPMV